jgi:hypothetical protein
MKKTVIASLIVMMVVGIAIVFAGNGNGLPTGPHYNLNIIGAPKEKTGDGFTNPDRHTIMVQLTGKTNIYMTQADEGDFAVIDGDGTDGRAEFELAPGYYEVYAVALGKPNKHVIITPEAEFDDQLGEEVFALGSIDLSHNKKPSWERVTGLFLVTVTIDVDGDPATTGDQTTYTNKWIFDIPELLEYYWDYDNNGCKLVQVRFYKVDAEPLP